MTTSATSTFELTRDQLLRRAFQLAGLLEASHSPTGNDLSMAADILGMELDALQSEGVILRMQERTTKALVAGTAAYALDSDVLDVAIDSSNVAGTFVPSSGGETLIRVISQAEYVQISNKTTQATPSLVMIERLASVTATFWPVPVASGAFRYSKIRLRRDTDTGAVTLDLAKRWQKAVAYSMAWQLVVAKSGPTDRVKMLKEIADEAKQKALASDAATGHIQMVVPRWSY